MFGNDVIFPDSGITSVILARSFNDLDKMLLILITDYGSS